VKIVHAGAGRKVLDDLDLMQALAGYLEQQDPELAQYRPTVLVGEFQEMMLGAINLGQELLNLQRFTANFADEPDVIIPTPYPELSSSRVDDEHVERRSVLGPGRDRSGSGGT
jgi:ubiquinone biosynthesis protein